MIEWRTCPACGREFPEQRFPRSVVTGDRSELCQTCDRRLRRGVKVVESRQEHPGDGCRWTKEDDDAIRKAPHGSRACDVAWRIGRTEAALRSRAGRIWVLVVGGRIV